MQLDDLCDDTGRTTTTYYVEISVERLMRTNWVDGTEHHRAHDRGVLQIMKVLACPYLHKTLVPRAVHLWSLSP